MNEFIEKLIKNLYESVKRKSCPDEACWEHLNKNCDYCDFKEIKVQDAIEIVNQLAEEFATDKNVGHNDQDLMIVESLPSLYPMQPFEVEAIDRVVRSAKHSGGWIPVAEHLPKEDMQCWATFESGNVDKIQYLASKKWWNGEMADNKVLAWKQIVPYKPKGE